MPEEASSKVESITYERLVNLGNYENERFAITLSPSSPDTTPRSLFNAAHVIIDKAIIDRKAGSDRKVR